MPERSLSLCSCKTCRFWIAACDSWGGRCQCRGVAPRAVRRFGTTRWTRRRMLANVIAVTCAVSNCSSMSPHVRSSWCHSRRIIRRSRHSRRDRTDGAADVRLQGRTLRSREQAAQHLDSPRRTLAPAANDRSPFLHSLDHKKHPGWYFCESRNDFLRRYARKDAE